MHTRVPGRLRRSLLILLAALGLGAATLAAPVHAVPDARATVSDGRSTTPEPSRLVAERTLAEAEAALAGAGADRSLTFVLRDLALARGHLPPAARGRAQALLQRPTTRGNRPVSYGRLTSAKRCGPDVCVHWVERGKHRVRDDRRLRTTPAFVRKTLREFQRIQATYVKAGYRPVRSDRGRGGNGKADIYLANLGPLGAYGYCTTDQRIRQRGPFQAWAYCVLDNDFSRKEFPTNTPMENMRVTAAHEYFHAVQFAHDISEDRWFMEATATWAEDELYDGVDDNLNYLGTSPLSAPEVPLDWFGDNHQYGGWIFFRYLTEIFDETRGDLPSLVRDIWVRAGSRPGSTRGSYSLAAIEDTLAERGAPSFGELFAGFADANRAPHLFYEEGAANSYPAAPSREFTLADGWYSTRLDHLTSASRDFVPDATSTAVQVEVDLGAAASNAFAVVRLHPVTGGEPQSRLVALDETTSSVLAFDFEPGSVATVDVTLVNASTRIDCGTRGQAACGGRALDDRVPARFRIAITG